MAPNLHDVEAYIFDLDGTLADTLADIGIAANVVLTGRGFPAFPLVRYREFVGAGGEVLLRRAFAAAEGHSADLPPQTASLPELLAEYIKAYRDQEHREARLYPGIRELLAALAKSGRRLAVLSNKRDEFARGLVAAKLGEIPFAEVWGERTGVPRKPDPTSALRIAEIIGISPGRIAFVGDSGVDMRTARASHMHAIGVNWGFRPREELVAEGALAILEHPRELLGLAGLSA